MRSENLVRRFQQNHSHNRYGRKAFIPDEAVVEDAAAVKPLYSATEIRTQRKSGIENRNQRKRECLNRLSTASRIWGVPYQIYYMSCNLDHVLYGKLNSTDDEKEADAFAFAKKYRDDIPSFMKAHQRIGLFGCWKLSAVMAIYPRRAAFT